MGYSEIVFFLFDRTRLTMTLLYDGLSDIFECIF